MNDFEGLRMELGIEAQQARRIRLRRLRRQHARAVRIARRVLRSLQTEVFHDSRVRIVSQDELVICRRAGNGSTRRARRTWIYDIRVRLLYDDDAMPTAVSGFECWREFEGNIPIGAVSGGEHSPSEICAPVRDDLVSALKTLVYRFPPGT